ncbi:unnamed protein product [Amoebophrya sp. A25]|nr:unnamed protein product [Amoebophrya sp. A25]|eukprot:GSA25T00017154001.1
MLRKSAQCFGKKFDCVIVGGGPGGYVAAIKAAQLGLNTACVEKRGTLGGTCLNVGCIPSKALLHASHQYHDALHSFKKNGINIDGNITVDVPTMMKQKKKNVNGLTKGIKGLFKANKVTDYDGFGFFENKNTIVIKDAAGNAKETIEADNIIVAVGSEVAGLPGFPKELIDEKDIVSSTGALDFQSVPKTMTVVGGGVIGLELGSVWSRLGAKVHVVEFLQKIMGPADNGISSDFQKILQKQGLTFDLNSRVIDVQKGAPGGVKIVWEHNETKEKTETVSEKVLISTGRIPNTAGCGIENLGISLDKAGRIPVDGHLITEGADHVYAIGDCIAGPMLAHKAEEDGVYVAEQIADKVKNGKPKKSHPVSYHAVPSVVYTYPEVAWVGKSEEELKNEGTAYSVAKFPLMANSRARANDETQGLVKLLTSADDKILGCHIIAPYAGDILMPAVNSMQYNRDCAELAHTCFAHPTVSEALKETAMKASFGNYIHNVG